MAGSTCPISLAISLAEPDTSNRNQHAWETLVPPGPVPYTDRPRYESAMNETIGPIVVADTTYPGYTEVPRDVMHGYTVMAEEAIHQLPDGGAPTHVFVQGRVGGLAAAVCARRPHVAVSMSTETNLVGTCGCNCPIRSLSAEMTVPSMK